MSFPLAKLHSVNHRHLHFILAALIVIWVVLTYANSLNNEFTNWDDYSLIVNNPHIKSLDFETVKEIFRFRLHGGTYQPLRVLSYAVDYKFWKLDPAGYHIQNILFHGVAAVFMYLSMVLCLPQIRQYYFTGVLPGSLDYTRLQLVVFFGTLLFAVHPVSVEAVTWLSSRKYVLLAAFSFSSFYFFLKSAREKAFHIPYNILSVLLFVAAAFSSPFGVILPALFFLFLYCRDTSNNPFSVLFKNFRPLFVYIVMGSLVFSFLWYRLVISSGGAAQFGWNKPLDTAIAMCQVTFDYARNFVCPIWLNCRYVDYIYLSFWDRYKNPAGLSIFVFLILLVLWHWKKGNKFYLFCLGWYFIAWLPVSNIIPISTQMADRYVYIASSGIYLVMVFFLLIVLPAILAKSRIRLFKEKEKTGLEPMMLVLMVVLAGVCTVLSMDRNAVWKNSGTLWRDSLEKNYNNFIAHANLGTYIFEHEGNVDKAMAHYRISHALSPEKLLPLENMGVILTHQGKYEAAVAVYEKILMIRPDWMEAYNYLGQLHYLMEDHEKAEACFSKILESDKTDGSAITMRGNALLNLGRLSEAVEMFKKGMALYPDYAELSYNLGIAYDKQGKKEFAVEQLERAIHLKPTLAEAYNDLGLIYWELRQPDKSETYLKKAVEINAGFSEAMNNLGNLMFEKNNFDEAGAYYSKAVKLNGDLVNARFNLCVLKERQGQTDDAFTCYESLIAKWPGHAQSLNNMGHILSQKQQWDAAEGFFRKATQKDDRYDTPHLNLAGLLKRKDNLVEAIEHYEQYIRLSKDLQSLREAALILNNMGQAAAAVNAYEKIIEMASATGDDFYNLGVLYARVGKNKAAYQMFQQALVVDPDNKNAKSILSRIVIEAKD